MRSTISADQPFTTKPVLARIMPARALQAGVPVSWVSADEAYGLESKFRRFLEEHHVSYVVAVPKSQWIGKGWGGQIRADTATAAAPAEAWKRRSCGQGAKGERLYDWALAEMHFETEPGYQRWLLVRRSLTPNTKGELELAYNLWLRPPLAASSSGQALSPWTSTRRPGLLAQRSRHR